MNDARIIDLHDSSGNVVANEWLPKAERVHRQLRGHLPADYVGKMQRVFRDGARMCVATRGDSVVGVAVYRVFENTADGLHLYVDDLVTDEATRSSGVGKALLDHLQRVARDAGCESFNLDSGVQRQRAHRFYLREGLFITGFHFAKALKRA